MRIGQKSRVSGDHLLRLPHLHVTLGQQCMAGDIPTDNVDAVLVLGGNASYSSEFPPTVHARYRLFTLARSQFSGTHG